MVCASLRISSCARRPRREVRAPRRTTRAFAAGATRRRGGRHAAARRSAPPGRRLAGRAAAAAAARRPRRARADNCARRAHQFARVLSLQVQNLDGKDLAGRLAQRLPHLGARWGRPASRVSVAAKQPYVNGPDDAPWRSRPARFLPAARSPGSRWTASPWARAARRPAPRCCLTEASLSLSKQARAHETAHAPAAQRVRGV